MHIHTRFYVSYLSLMVLGIACFVQVACSISSEKYFGKITHSAKQVLFYANHSEPRSLDPHKTAGLSEGNIIKELFEGLTTYHPQTLEPIAAGAVSWEEKELGQQWIFHLRRHSRWSDGSLITTKDYIYAWRRAVNPATACPYVSLFFYIKNAENISNGQMDVNLLGVKAIDDYTLQVDMKTPTIFFIKLTSHYVFAPLPQWTIEKYNSEWVNPDNIVYNGPFKLVKHKINDEVLLNKNLDYWDALNVQLEEVHFFPVKDYVAINLYKAGEVDVLMSGMIPLSFTSAIKNKRDYHTGTFFSTYFYSINVTKPPLDNLLVRKALNQAINKIEIAAKLLGCGEIAATTLIPSGVIGYPKSQEFQYDPEKAKKLFQEAGYPNGKNFPKLTVFFNTDSAHQQIAEAIQRMWKEVLNISVDLQSEEWQTFQARRERRDFEICRDDWQGDYLDPNTFLDLFKTDTINNHTGWIDIKYSNLLERAGSEPDTTKRFRLLLESEKYLIDSMPIIPIYFSAVSYLKKPYVMGWNTNLLDIHPLKYVYLEQKSE